MPEVLSLKINPPLITLDRYGQTVPWETFGYREEAKTAEMAGGIFDLSHWGVVRVEGQDSGDFLHRMSTVNMKNLTPEQVRHAAFLTGKGTVISLGMLLTLTDAYYVVVPPGNAPKLAEHLEKFHFGEKLTISDVSGAWALLGLWVHESTDHLPRPRGEFLLETSEERHLWCDDLRDALTWALIPRATFASYWAELQSLGLKPLGQRLFEFFRVSAGIPQVGVELGEQDIILEGNFDRAVARSKGCYPGQEVVERIFTYGQVNRKLFTVHLEWPSDDLPITPLPFSVDQKEAVKLVSYLEHPHRHRTGTGLAFVRRNYWDFKGKFSSENGVTLEFKTA